MIKTLKAVLSSCILLAIGAAVNAQMIEPPPYQITSDYGPRKVSQGSFFHPAIDYGAPLYSSIVPVESGVITDIAYGGAWYVRLSGFNGAWSYLHLFTGLGTTPVTTADPWELRQANLEDPDTGNVVSSLVIIRWLVPGSTNAAYIWSVNPGKIIKLGVNSYVLGADNQPVQTKNYISALTDFIGPSGNSGGYPAHLDVRLNDGDDNPLYYLMHPPDSLPIVGNLQPENGHLMTEAELVDYSLKAEVRGGGLDLDKVSFWIYKNGNFGQAIHIGTPGLPTFGYGGRVGESQNGFSIISPSDGINTGVQPFDVEVSPGKFDSLGHDRFVSRQNLNDLNLPDGEHKFVVKIKDVNGNEPAEMQVASVNFIIDKNFPVLDTLEPVAGATYTATPLPVLVGSDPPEPLGILGTASEPLANVEVGLSGPGGWWDGEKWAPAETYHVASFISELNPDTGVVEHVWAYGGFASIDDFPVGANPYTLHVKAIDFAGNAVSSQRNITINKEDPTQAGAYIDFISGDHVGPQYRTVDGVDGHIVGQAAWVQMRLCIAGIADPDAGKCWDGTGWGSNPEASCASQNVMSVSPSGNNWVYPSTTWKSKLKSGQSYVVGAKSCFNSAQNGAEAVRSFSYDTTRPTVLINEIVFPNSSSISKLGGTAAGTFQDMPDVASVQISIIDKTSILAPRYWSGTSWEFGENIVYLGANYLPQTGEWTYNMVGGALSKDGRYIVLSSQFETFICRQFC